MAAALVFGVLAVIGFLVVGPPVLAGKFDKLLDRVLGPDDRPRRVRDWEERRFEEGRRAHYASCDAMAKRPANVVELRPNASRGRRAA